MLKRIVIIGGAVVGVIAIVLIAGLLYMRSYFSAEGAKAVASVVGETGAKRVLGVFAHPDDEQLVTGFFSYAKEKDGAFTSLVTGTKGEAGHQVPTVARQQDLGIVRKAEALKNGFALGIDDQQYAICQAAGARFGAEHLADGCSLGVHGRSPLLESLMMRLWPWRR